MEDSQEKILYPAKKVVLLDLNNTLAMATGLNTRNWTYDVTKDRYSQQLVDILSDTEKYEVHLITARPTKYEVATLAKIEKDTGFVPHKAIFKPVSKKYTKVHFFKAEYLQGLLDSGVEMENIIAVESNSATKAEYKKLGMKKYWRRQEYLKTHGITE